MQLLQIVSLRLTQVDHTRVCLTCARQVQQPSEYNRESWALNDKERLNKVPMLHGQGNKLFKQGLFEEATEKYKEAIVCLKNIQSKARCSLSQ